MGGENSGYLSSMFTLVLYCLMTKLRFQENPCLLATSNTSGKKMHPSMPSIVFTARSETVQLTRARSNTCPKTQRKLQRLHEPPTKRGSKLPDTEEEKHTVLLARVF